MSNNDNSMSVRSFPNYIVIVRLKTGELKIIGEADTVAETNKFFINWVNSDESTSGICTYTQSMLTVEKDRIDRIL